MALTMNKIQVGHTPTGRGPGLAPKGFIKAKFTVNTRDFTNLTRNLDIVLNQLVPALAAQGAAQVAIDLLRNALPRTPIASREDGTVLPYGGKLRESGRATVVYREGKEIADVGFGQKNGGVVVDLSRLKTAKGVFRGAHTIGSRVTFHRTNAKGEDIALWTHEDLLKYVPRPKPIGLMGKFVARHPGTGPKYLESVWLEKKSVYETFLKKVLSNQSVAKAVMQIGGKPPSSEKYKLAPVKLNSNRIPNAMGGVGKP